MPDLFALAMPWWEFILRAVVVYVVVLGMVRLGGKRALGQITPFDVLLIVLLGNAVQNALLGTDTSLGGGLLLAATLILLNYGVGWLKRPINNLEDLKKVKFRSSGIGLEMFKRMGVSTVGMAGGDIVPAFERTRAQPASRIP